MRYGLSPWDSEIDEIIENDYRRGLAIAALDCIRSKEDYVIDILTEQFPEFMKNLIDVAATHICNEIVACAPFVKKRGKQKKMRKSIFKKEKSMMKFPKRDGGFREVKIV